MQWTWDSAKNRSNKRKHHLSFETAQFVFDDPLAVSRLDTGSEEERWQTVGSVGGVTIVVAHTSPGEEDDGAPGRIMSARRATRNERRAYEEGDF